MLTWETQKQIIRYTALCIAGTSLVLLACAGLWSAGT